MLAGAAASVALAPTLGHPLLSVIWGIAVGIGYSASLRPSGHAYVDNLMTGAALGIPMWGVISVIALPLLSGQTPEWSADQMRMHFPALVGWVLYGALLGLFTQGLTDISETVLGPEAEGLSPEPPEKKRIVILGGGFAGMRTAGAWKTSFKMKLRFRSRWSVIRMRFFSLQCLPKWLEAASNPVTLARLCAAASIARSSSADAPIRSISKGAA